MQYTSFFVIEDSATIRKVIRIMFENIGSLFVGEASNGIDAIQELSVLKQKKTLPTVITLDVKLPGVSGDQLVPKLHFLFPHATIIIITSITDKIILKRCLEMGAHNVIIKPVTFEKILKVCELLTVDALVEKQKLQTVKSKVFQAVKHSGINFDVHAQVESIMAEEFDKLVKNDVLKLMNHQNQQVMMKELKNLMVENLEHFAHRLFEIKNENSERESDRGETRE